MNEDFTYIKLYRRILNNPVVCKDADHFAIWVYLLLVATHTEREKIFKGKKITLNPGQLITGRIAISEKLSISQSKVQRVLKNLENEQQIEQQTSNRNRLITILNWNDYQGSEQRIEQQVNNKRTTTEQQVNTYKNDKNVKNDKNINKEKENPKAKSIRFVPPSLEEVEVYCKSRNNKVDAGQFIDFYESKGWMVGKNKMKDWKASVRTWEKRDSQPKAENKPTNKFNQFPQRTYTASDYADIERKLINKGL